MRSSCSKPWPPELIGKPVICPVGSFAVQRLLETLLSGFGLCVHTAKANRQKTRDNAIILSINFCLLCSEEGRDHLSNSCPSVLAAIP